VRTAALALALAAGCAGGGPPAPAVDPAPAAASAPLVTPEPNAGRLERMQQLEQRVREVVAGGQPVSLVFLGDSITEGWEGAGAEVWARRDAARGALNLGVGGDRTQNVLYRLRAGQLDGLAPRVLVLLIGTNNTGNGLEPPGEIRDGIAAILDQLAVRMPDTRVLLLAVFPRGRAPDDAARLNNEAVNRLLPALCDGRRAVFLDSGPAFTEAGGELSPAIMPDALHLSPEGYERWAAAMEPPLERLLGG